MSSILARDFFQEGSLHIVFGERVFGDRRGLCLVPESIVQISGVSGLSAARPVGLGEGSQGFPGRFRRACRRFRRERIEPGREEPAP